MSITENELQDIKVEYPRLCSSINGVGQVEISGTVNINKVEDKYPQYHLDEDFDIKIVVQGDYPKSIPIVYEQSGKIPVEYEHKYRDNSLCLGTNIDILSKCNGKVTIKRLIENFIIPYLFSYRFLERFDFYPFDDRSHGFEGLFETYSEMFNTLNLYEIIFKLNRIVKQDYRGHRDCVCGSGKKARDCHPVEKQLLKLAAENENVMEQFKLDLTEFDKAKEYLDDKFYKKAKRI